MSQFWSAWTVPQTPWSAALKVKDLDIASLTVSQSENNCATLTVVVRNPQVGLLSPGRLVWLWLAWEDDSGTTTPLFYGRLVPVPNRTTNEGQGATLTFVSRPLDFDFQKFNASLSLEVFPFYDPVFIDPARRLTPIFGNSGTGAPPPIGSERPPQSTANPDIVGYSGDPDAVLEGWARLWSIDRVTGVVDSSDILEGEDGTEVFNSSEIPAETIQISTATSVQTDVTVIGKVNWTQTEDFSSLAGGGFGVSINGAATNGDSLTSGWPKAGSTIAGYDVVGSTVTDFGFDKAQVQQKGFNYVNRAKTHKQGDVMSINWNFAEFPKGLEGDTYLVSESVQQATAPQLDTGIGLPNLGGPDDPNLPFHFSASILMIANMPFSCAMTLRPSSNNNSASIPRSETLTLKLSADIQPLVTLPTSGAGPSAASPISVNGADVGLPIDGIAPISGPSASNYFPSARGQQSVSYLVAIGVANLKSANRAVSISTDIPFGRAIALSCRKNATINAHTLPGGTATGKVTAYSFTADGPNMQLKGNVTISCCIGNGGTGTVAGVTGDPSIAVDGTFLSGVQVAIGASTVFDPNTAGLGDVSFSPLIYVSQTGEPTFPLSANQLLIGAGLSTEMADVQVGTSIDPYTGDLGPPVVVSVPISVFNLQTLDVGTLANASPTGSFDAVYDLTTSLVKLPKQIDLTVASW